MATALSIIVVLGMIFAPFIIGALITSKGNEPPRR